MHVFSFRVSTTQYSFLKSLGNAPKILRAFIDSMKIQEMPIARRILFLLKKIENEREGITEAKKFLDYLKTKKINPTTGVRRATEEEYQAHREKHLQKGWTEKELDTPEMLQQMWTMRPDNPAFFEHETRLKAHETLFKERKQRLADLKAELQILKKSLGEAHG